MTTRRDFLRLLPLAIAGAVIAIKNIGKPKTDETSLYDVALKWAPKLNEAKRRSRNSLDEWAATVNHQRDKRRLMSAEAAREILKVYLERS